MQYTAFLNGCKRNDFQLICFYPFLILAQNIDCVYTLDHIYCDVYVFKNDKVQLKKCDTFLIFAQNRASVCS